MEYSKGSSKRQERDNYVKIYKNVEEVKQFSELPHLETHHAEHKWICFCLYVYIV